MDKKNQDRILVLLLSLTLAATGCASGYKKYECAVDPSALSPDPQAIWACHRDTVQRVIKDKKFTLLEFREAGAFFERLTGIGAAAHESPFGPIPSDELKARVEQWDAWYATHAEQLLWNDEERTVELRTTGG